MQMIKYWKKQMDKLKAKKLIVTGGAGFIGSALVRFLIKMGVGVVNIDKLTYCGHLSSLTSVENSPLYKFYQLDINDSKSIRDILIAEQPDGIIHLAAESHVDRSIDEPSIFMKTNILGTYTLLQESLNFWKKTKKTFRFHHVSTDEVFGSLGKEGYFDELSPYDPRSPYSASKASSDHLVRAWYHTYGLPISISNCSNNYGPYQSPEKLIPQMIIRAIQGKPLTVYGNGKNVRDWIFVDDHVRALFYIFEKANIGATYLVGGHQEKTNLEVVKAICKCLDKFLPKKGHSYLEQIEFVQDRPGHDFRYAINPRKLNQDLKWNVQLEFTQGIEMTVRWYLQHSNWWQDILSKQTILERQGVI